MSLLSYHHDSYTDVTTVYLILFIRIYVHLIIDLYVQALFSNLHNPVLSLIIESLPV